WFCRFFFFSSRRRHTRSDRDWSSDVCSSDLFSTLETTLTRERRLPVPAGPTPCRDIPWAAVRAEPISLRLTLCFRFQTYTASTRSEERRVGKECRTWWWPEH